VQNNQFAVKKTSFSKVLAVLAKPIILKPDKILAFHKHITGIKQVHKYQAVSINPVKR